MDGLFDITGQESGVIAHPGGDAIICNRSRWN